MPEIADIPARIYWTGGFGGRENGMRVKKRPVLSWIIFAAWAATVTIFSSVPGKRIETLPFAVHDKLIHAALFLVGAFLLFTALRWTLSWPQRGLFFLAVAFMVAFGALDEFHQLFTPGRSGADPGDLAADAIGATLGSLLGVFVNGRRPAKPDLGTPRADRAA
jgi:VanZ family protein